MTPALEIVAKRLDEAGVPAHVNAGIIANLAHESEGDPEAIGDGGTSIGLAQWHNERATALMDFADARKASPKDASVQADYLLQELSEHPDLPERLAKTKTPGEAADVFQREFERPKNIDPERSQTAVEAFNWLQRKGIGAGAPLAGQVTADKPVPQGTPLGRIGGAAAEGARAGWGEGPVGLGPEAAAMADQFGILGPLIRGAAVGADALGRGVSAATRGFSGAVGQTAVEAGYPTAGGQLRRDLPALADIAGIASGATPRAMGSPGKPRLVQQPATVAAGARGSAPAPTLAAAAERPTLVPPGAPAIPAEAPRPIIIDPLAGPTAVPNLARITSTDEAKNLIAETAEVYRGSIDEARRGVMTHEATRQLADQLAVTPEQVVSRWKKGGVLNAEEMLAARDTLVSSAEQVMIKAKEAKERGGTANSELFELLTRHQALQETVQGYTAEAGRLLSSFNVLSRDGRARIIGEAIENSGGQWDEVARRLAAATPEEMAGVIRELPQATTLDKLHFAWINGLLSSPTTHMANMLGNVGSQVFGLVESAIAEVMPGRGVRFGETAARAGGMTRGMLEGFSAAYDAMRRGTLGPSKVEAGTAGGSGKLANALAVVTPTRWLGAEDAFFKAIAYRGEIGAQAVRQAKGAGLKGDALRGRIRELSRAPTDAMKEAAEKAADYQTFQSELGKAGKAMQKLRRDLPGGRWIVPFLKTPANLTKYAVERSPLGAARLLAPSKFGLETTAAKQQALAKSVVGTSIGLIAADLASQGIITGAGPSDPGERGVWLEDHAPFSVKWNDQWTSYDRLDPLSLIIGSTADFVDLAKRDTSDETLDEKAAEIAGAIARNLTSKTWLQGPVAWVMALADPERYGERPLQQLVASVVPSAVGMVARTMDTNSKGEQISRPSENVWDAVKARIPGMREELPPSIGTLGKVVTSRPAFGPLLPQKVKSAEVNPVAEAMRRAEFFPRRTTGKFTVGGRSYELEGKDLAQFRKDSGTMFSEIASQVLANPQWFKMAPEDQRKILASAHDRALTVAKARYLSRTTPGSDGLVAKSFGTGTNATVPTARGKEGK